MFGRLKRWFLSRKRLDELLDQAEESITRLVSMNSGLETGFGLLNQKTRQDHNASLRIIAGLVAVQGGRVVISKDIVDMVNNENDITVTYTLMPDGSKAIVLVDSDEEREAANKAIDDAYDDDDDDDDEEDEDEDDDYEADRDQFLDGKHS